MEVGVLVWFASLLLASASLPAAPPDPLTTIRGDDMRQHVIFLAADELAGRETGEPSIAIAERYVATAFSGYGLEPLPGQGDFAVPFTLYRRGYDMEATGVETDGASCRAGVDCRPFPFSASGEVEAPVVFAGYGIHAPDQGWDDYSGLDVEGKLVLILRHGPGEADDVERIAGDHQQFTVKAQKAEKQGALGMILVTDPLNHEGADDFRLGGRLSLEPRPPGESSSSDEAGFLAIHVSRDFAGTLLQGSTRSLDDLQRALDDGTPARELSIGSPTATVRVVERGESEQVEARNVVGVLPGSDPELRDEWVVVGAHHDHVGAYTGPGDTVFNGADDNASGVSGVLELAQAFASRETPPKRTLVFATFSAEEKGLLGSRALVNQNTLPMGKLVFMLNLDMIGRNSDAGVQVFGDGFVRDLRSLVEDVNGDDGIDLAFAGHAYEGNSDHDAFKRKAVPFMFFFTGTHEDYHQIGDHAAKLDYPRMQQIARLAYGVLERWGGLDRPLSFIHRVGWLGISVERREIDGAASAEVTAVEEDSRGSKVGLREGDRLVSIGGREVLTSAIGESFDLVAAGSTAELVFDRSGKSKRVEIERVRPGYMGVMTGAVDAETRKQHGLIHGEGLLLRRVVPDGPSAKAGLIDGDIVLRVDGRPVDDTSLRSRLGQLGAGTSVLLDVLRDGEPIEISLTFGERPRR